MNQVYKQLTLILGIFLLIPFASFAGNNPEMTSTDAKQVIGKRLKITHVDFKGLDLPATTQFEIEFTDSEHCVIFINGQRHEAIWVFNDRTKSIDVKNVFLGSIKSFTVVRNGHNVDIMQRVNEEEMHRMIVAVLK